ncbi:MAG: ATP-binding cassette domain-containing protein [Treponema sp.]|jgi:zinc transport system ATP-binding protein|nr:ATP-binding cassette domain-containing protein [Treponema sp.]
MAVDAILTCQNVSFGYDGHIVVHNLTFSVERGDYLCIVGENGSGKSTLIKGVLRLITPLQGSIIINAGSAAKSKAAPQAMQSSFPKIKGNAVGYLSQASAAKKDFPAGVAEIVFSGMTGGMGLRPFYSRKEKELAERAMGRLAITALRNRCFRELSGGQQRRVLIARALCAVLRDDAAWEGNASACRKMLVLDEPAAGLDPLVTAELYQLLQTLNTELGVAIIMVSHDIDSALKYTRHILHITAAGSFYGTHAEYTQSDHYKRLIGGNDK